MLTVPSQLSVAIILVGADGIASHSAVISAGTLSIVGGVTSTTTIV